MTKMCIAVLYLSLLLHSGEFSEAHNQCLTNCRLVKYYPSCSAGLAVVVLQSDEQISLPGGRVTLECQMGPGVDMTSYTMLWYRQQQYRAPLEFLATEYDQNTGHLQASIDRSTNRFYLHITELFANDSSMYYCAASHSDVNRPGSHTNIICASQIAGRQEGDMHALIANSPCCYSSYSCGIKLINIAHPFVILAFNS